MTHALLEQHAPGATALRRVLHVLDHSQPHRSGYAMRSSSILQFQRQLGLEPVVLTSPKHGPAAAVREEIGGIAHHRTDPSVAGLGGRWGDIPFFRELRQIRTMRRRIEEVARVERAELIHAHSPSLNGIPAAAATRRLGLPFVYEVRAFWEDAAVDHGTFAEGSLRYRLSRMVETGVFRRADAITVICGGLRNELVARGIPASKITVIPNGVDLERFAPRAPSPAVLDQYGLRGQVILGFLGSFYRYEGLSLLLDACTRLRELTPEARLLLVGSGEEETNLQARSEALGLGSAVVFTGSVPPDQVLDLYSVVDILVYPRLSMRLTDWVTPLKPLEAMAMGKVVVGSDVRGLRELIRDGETGLLFPAGDAEALARTLRQAITDRDRWAEIGTRARQYVAETRRWADIVARYPTVYGQARAHAARWGRCGLRGER
jgi:PEP-CTERM/exosortase A-associated glycosyltransferase